MSALKILHDVVEKGNLSRIKTVLAVAAGKGGVGKSSVAVNLALALKRKGYRVGLLDADVYGPSLEQMLPKGLEPADDIENPKKLLPGMTLGMPFISVAHFRREASIVRAPIANQIIGQFLDSVEWGELDYLIIDFPPGTGDIQLTLMQKGQITGAVMVTTPQIVATLDVRKAIQLFLKMKIPVLGVIENMSYFLEPISKQQLFPFGRGGAEALAGEFDIAVLGQIPIDPAVSAAGDQGESLFEIGGVAAEAFEAICLKIVENQLVQPTIEVEQSGPFHLGVMGKRVSLHELQKRCPCARCEIQKKCDENVSLLEFSLVGRYAIRITFSSGCSRGIYPITMLEQLAQ
ncbi:MAG: P-loop NTPase [Verrucomicrobia bacterium]|nr:P-loop NTPase [Verrucomicrobiota bacterium]